LGLYWGQVRQWPSEKQAEFFAKCIARAESVIADYTEENLTVPANKPPHNLQLNNPSGSRRRPVRFTFERFVDVLVGRVVVLGLCNARCTWRYDEVLGIIFLGELTSSYSPIMANLGFPTFKKRTLIDHSKLRLLPHEIKWSENKAFVHQALESPLTPEERQWCDELSEAILLVLKRVESDFRVGAFSEAWDYPETGQVALDSALEQTGLVRFLAELLRKRTSRDPVRERARVRVSGWLLGEVEDLLGWNWPSGIGAKAPLLRENLEAALSALAEIASQEAARQELPAG
jgi:hypothetical protein